MGGFAAKVRLIASEVVLPPICLVCRRRLVVRLDRRFWICSPCREKFKASSPYIFCSECGARLSGIKDHCHPRNGFPVFAPLDYGYPPVRELIHAFKYDHGRVAARFLAQIISGYSDSAIQNLNFPLNDSVLVPIPLYPDREKERGFNQSLVLAKALVETAGPFYGLKTSPDALFKTKSAPSQAKTKSREGRMSNIIDSFGADARLTKNDIVIVDDVFTTGATMREAARVLKESGARSIFGLAAARA